MTKVDNCYIVKSVKMKNSDSAKNKDETVCAKQQDVQP